MRPGGPDGPDGPDGHLCPECGAPRAADNTPSCGCGQRVSEALRDARTAEAAAAEDFDPLRIRPYVELEGDGETMPLLAVPPTAPPLTPLSPPATTPSARDLSLFEPDTAVYEEDDRDGTRRARAGHRRTRTALLGVGGALVAVLAAAGLASGLFTYETPSRDKALPDDVRASVPVPSTSEASEEPSPAGTSAQPAPPPAPPSPAESESPSPSPSRSSASPTPSRSAEPTTAPSTAEATDSQEESAAALAPEPPTLSRGDRGPEVTELELRLTQLGLYTRKASGNYNEGVEDAVSRYQWARGVQPQEYGVYDLATREKLESETTEP
ncbi:peptidoglycan-binding domain-containing protein [Streptomyces cyaneus]|uniref:peptidoglycan-binding domain-containing protein n=1 Tax=Streptomyces cyaneus TaxID=1904 RepID=UPI001FE82D88|nr:peptidoglycan-binding domain-containing protein [Streptomyces cyaneus]